MYVFKTESFLWLAGPLGQQSPTFVACQWGWKVEKGTGPCEWQTAMRAAGLTTSSGPALTCMHMWLN